MDSSMEMDWSEEQNWSSFEDSQVNGTMCGFQQMASADDQIFLDTSLNPFSLEPNQFADIPQNQLLPNTSQTLASTNVFNCNWTPSQPNQTFPTGNSNQQHATLNLFSLPSTSSTGLPSSDNQDGLMLAPPVDPISSASAPRPVANQQRKRMTPQEWAEQRPRIRSLYVDQDLSLPRTMKLMEETYEFHASNDQANFMYRKARKRMAEDGKKIVFHINGVQVPPGKVERLLKSDRQNLGSTTGTTPSFMDYATVSEPATPRAQGSLVSGDASLDFLRLKWKGHDAKALHALETGGLKLIDEEKFEEAASAFRDAFAGFDYLVGPAGDSTIRLLKHLSDPYMKQETLESGGLIDQLCQWPPKSFWRSPLQNIAEPSETWRLIFERLEENARREAADAALYSTIHLFYHYYHEKKIDHGVNFILQQLSIFETLGDQSSSMVLKKWVPPLYGVRWDLFKRVERIILEILDLYEKEPIIFLKLLFFTLRWYGLPNLKEKLAVLLDRTIQIINDVRQKETKPSSHLQLQIWRLEGTVAVVYLYLRNSEKSERWISRVRESVEAERGVHSEEAIWTLMLIGRIKWWEKRWDDAESLYREAFPRVEAVFGRDSEVIAKISKCLEKDPESCKSVDWDFSMLPSGHGKFLNHLLDTPFLHTVF
ncbi:MAG: hypothetical protein MMC33_008792 [Icmadophila ericetorum]|nr:hypothetical protein [Icmadophila ericetorum]